MLNPNIQPYSFLNFNLNSANSVNNTLIKAIPTTLVSAAFSNNAVTAAFIKFFDKATLPVAGTDTPVFTLNVPAGSQAIITIPLAFSVGLGIAITNLVGDLDNTAVAAGQIKCKINYQ